MRAAPNPPDKGSQEYIAWAHANWRQWHESLVVGDHVWNGLYGDGHIVAMNEDTYTVSTGLSFCRKTGLVVT